MILLLENKDNRLPQELPKDDFICIKENSNCNESLKNFLENPKSYDQYTTIIIHANIYEENDREDLFEELKKYCKKEKKKLVIFSGDGGLPSLTDSSSMLTLSAVTLYKNLIAYANIPIDEQDLLVLAFGENALYNLLLNTLENMNLYIENFEKDNVLFDTFENETFDALKNVLEKDKYNNLRQNINAIGFIDVLQMKEIANNLKKLIQEKANV